MAALVRFVFFLTMVLLAAACASTPETLTFRNSPYRSIDLLEDGAILHIPTGLEVFLRSRLVFHRIHPPSGYRCFNGNRCCINSKTSSRAWTRPSNWASSTAVRISENRGPGS